MKRICCLLIAVLFAFGIINAGNTANMFSARAEGISAGIAEEKIYCTATLENNFVDNEVIVVMTNLESLKFHTYGTSSFREISCAAVENITAVNASLLQSKIANQKNASRQSTKAIDTSRFHQILVLTLKETGKEKVLEAVKKLEQRSDVLIAEPNYILEMDIGMDSPTSTTGANEPLPVTAVNSISTNDPYDSYWPRVNISLPQAWNITTGSNSVIVGVVDSGISTSHPDLAGRVDTNLSRDFTLTNPAPGTGCTDDFGHGTHVAGIIGASTNNGVGISGVCWNVKLASLKVYTSRIDNVNSDWVINAINYAQQTLGDSSTANDIRILNMSFSFKNMDLVNTLSLMCAINGYDGMVICAAGNSGKDNDIIDHYPSDYTTQFENIISVGASTHLDKKASFSNYGSETVDVYAPGIEITSCYPEFICYGEGLDVTESHVAMGYHKLDGTSMAAPFVTGVVALMMAEAPALLDDDFIHDTDNPNTIKKIIKETADVIPDFHDGSSGRRLNAYEALLACDTYVYTRTIAANTQS